MATSSHPEKSSDSSANNTSLTRRDVLTVVALGAVAAGPGAAFAAGPRGQLTWASTSRSPRLGSIPPTRRR